MFDIVSQQDLHNALGSYVTITVGSFVLLTFAAVSIQQHLSKSLIKEIANKALDVRITEIKKDIYEANAATCSATTIALLSPGEPQITAAVVWGIRTAKYQLLAENHNGLQHALEQVKHNLKSIDHFKEALETDVSLVSDMFDTLKILRDSEHVDKNLVEEILQMLDEKYKNSIRCND